LTDLDDYMKANLTANKSRENRKKFTANDPYYANIEPISDIEKGINLSKSEQELQDLLPLTEEKRVDICKSTDPDIVLVQTLKRRAQCKRPTCQYKWLTKSTRA
jgi:hypothetical protein